MPSLLHSPKKIMFAVAAYDHKVNVEFMDSLLTTQLKLIAKNITPVVVVRSGCCHVDSARNDLTALFLASDADELLFIDADEAWNPDEMVEFCRIDRDIVGACPPKKQEEEAYGVLIDSNEIVAVAGLVEVMTVGTGCLKIKRKVLESLRDKSKKYTDGGKETYFIFERKVIGEKLWSGDNVFCLKAKAEGFKIYVYPEMTWKHMGHHVWEGNLGNFWRKTCQSLPTLSLRHQSRLG